MAGGCLHSTRNPPILCMSFQTNILLSGCSYLVNNPCFNAEVKSGLLHQLYYPIFTLGRYGRVVTVFPPGKAKLSCLYSAHNLPVLSITCILAYAPNLPEVRILGISPKCSKFGLNSGSSSKNWNSIGLLWLFDIQTYIFRLTTVMSGHNVSYP